jgi:hypothetical protein
MTLTEVLLSEMLWPNALEGQGEFAAVKKLSTRITIAASFFIVGRPGGKEAMSFLHPSRVYAAGYFEPAPLAAPVAAASFAVPLAHAFPFFAIGDDRIAFVKEFLQCWARNAVDNRYDLNRTALGTCPSSLSWAILVAGFSFRHGWVSVKFTF